MAPDLTIRGKKHIIGLRLKRYPSFRRLPHHHTQVAIVGSGLAGLSLSLRLAQAGVRCALLTKAKLASGSTAWAQGGIAAVLDPHDSTRSHVDDTLTAGAGLCHQEVVQLVVQNSARAIDWLTREGVAFDPDGATGTGYHLAREGGHTHRRVAHVADSTGQALVQTLNDKVLDAEHLSILEGFIAIDLITRPVPGRDPANQRCLGLYALNAATGTVETIAADAVVLACGGASKAYLYTSNPDTSTGDGVAMAWRAGCRVANMEFVQFHPTCLYHPHAGSFLVSESVRGEGGVLRLPNGSRFMQNHDPRAELAPRDIVARAIDYEMKRAGLDCVYLDISHQPKDFITSHFPTIYRRCLELGIDMAKEPVPCVPAAHYTCGGVITDTHGRTDITALYALGETTFTGLHGANRLASNSLLECVVFAERAADSITRLLDTQERSSDTLPDWDESQVTDPDELVVISHNWDELRRFMWDYVGIVRTSRRLQRAANRLHLLGEEIRDFYSNFKVNADLLELRNLVLVAELIVRCAAQRKESRGLHYTLDYPASDQAPAQDTVLDPLAD